jgi:hypothetical protein
MTKLDILKEVFYVLSASLLIFLIMELISPNIILAFLNINLVLISWIIIGIMILVNNEKKDG